MSLCPKCGRMYCDHEPEERGQTFAEMMRPLTDEERAAFDTGDDTIKLEVARRLAHAPVPGLHRTITLPEGFDPGERTITAQYFGD